MLLRVLEWTAAAVLALACVPVLAETECSASVCQDGTWPTMEISALPIVLDQHFDDEVIADMVSGHVTTDESVAGHEETVHLHQYASLDEVMEQAEQP